MLVNLHGGLEPSTTNIEWRSKFDIDADTDVFVDGGGRFSYLVAEPEIYIYKILAAKMKTLIYYDNFVIS